MDQFSERSAFVRELVQNSLDAGAGRIEVRVHQDKRRLRVDVVDDGEGMDQDIIEGYLLTLFRSSKEEDLTKIGKFGVGFVSLFAVDPELVTVDTGRDGRHWRVLFDKHRKYTLAEVDEPFEGTTVTLYCRTWGKKAGKLAKEIFRAAHYWCRFASAEVWTEGTGSKHFGWGPEEVSHPFTTGQPCEVQVEEPELRAVVAYADSRPAAVGYYNRGLTLLETHEDTVSGITFRVEAKALEHTVTRDNVRRDAGYRKVVARLKRAARDALPGAFVAALRQSIDDDPERHQALLRLAAANPHIGWTPGQKVLRTLEGSHLSLRDLRSDPLGIRHRECFHAASRSRLTDALAQAGEVVFPSDGGEVAFLERLGIEVQPAGQAWFCPERVDHPLADAITEAEWGEPCAAAHFAGGGERLEHAFAVRAGRRVSLDRWRDDPGPVLVVNADHPTFERLAALPLDLAAPILLHAARRALGEETSPSAILEPITSIVCGEAP
ncbi:MAG: ATP-binding protein [Deltaproteobacteria bacterium]|nr:ATP-binding protein [Deltaproteobacteria bacterium]